MARKINRGGLIQGVGIPNFSAGADQLVSSQAYGNLGAQLDGMFKFANKLSEEQLIKEAKEFAVDNPIQLEDYLNANPTERAAMLQGNDYTTFGKTIKATQANVLATNMAIAANNNMNTLKADAILNGTDLGVVEQSFNALVNGYVDAIADVDAETAIVLKGKLATSATTKYNSILENRITDIKNARKASAMSYSKDLISNISDMFHGTFDREILNADGKFTPITVDEEYESVKKRYVQELIGQNFNASEISNFVNKLDEKYLTGKKNKIFKEAILSVDNVSVNKKVKGVIDGTFNGDVSTRKMFESLPEDEQKDVLKQVREYRENFIKDQENKEKAEEAYLADTKNDIEEEYANADINNNRKQAEDAISLMEKLDPKRASEMRDEFQQDEENEVFLDPEVKSFLDEQLFSGSLDVGTVRKLREEKIISQKTMTTYIKGISTARNAKLSTIDKIARRRFGITDEGRSSSDANQEAMVRYQKIMEQIYTYAEDNPNASPEQIMDQYNNIAEETDRILTLETNITDSQKQIMANTFLQRGKSWVRYLRTYGGEGLTGVESSDSMNKILRNEDETRNLIRELRELHDLVKNMKLGLTKTPDGDNLDEVVPFDMEKPSQIIQTINGLESHLRLLEQRN